MPKKYFLSKLGMIERNEMLTQEQADVDPSLVPQWKWKAAKKDVRLTKGSSPCPDQDIADAIEFLLGKPNARSSAIDQARQIFRQDGLVRAELEARVLADQSPEEIATHCRLPVEVVTTYEGLFFCVRRYLIATDWVHLRTVGRAHRDGFENDQLRQLWAWLAFNGGPLIIDHIIDVFRRVAGPNPPCSIAPYLREGAAVPVEMQVMIANLVIPADADGLRSSIDLHVRQMEIETLSDREVRRELKREAGEAVVKYARKVLEGKPRKWKPLAKDDPGSRGSR